jgi:hypothetical protein
MRRAIPVLLGLVLIAGCGDDKKSSTPTSGTPAAATPAGVKTVATTSTPAAPAAAAATPSGAKSPYVDVTSLLGKQLKDEPGCTFAKNFVPNARPPAYDGGLALTVSCHAADGYTPIGQIVNRPGSKPTEISCKDTNGGQLYCLYVPSTTVGLYFTGTNRAVVRRRLEHLMEMVRPLPTGISAIAGAASP